MLRIRGRIPDVALFPSLQERQRECAEAMDRIAVERSFDYWGLFDGLTRMHEEWRFQPSVLLIVDLEDIATLTCFRAAGRS